ncbi:11369_t:CDS:2, partial [Ambispora leptoticha]
EICPTQMRRYDESRFVSGMFKNTPRGFSRILRAKEIREKKFEGKKLLASSPSSAIAKRKSKQHSSSLQGHFSSRINAQMRSDILKSIKEESSTKIKKKRFLEKFKQKRKEKETKLLKELEVKDFDSFQDHVKFGEVVNAPPSITAIPKQRGSSKLIKNNQAFDNDKLHQKNNRKHKNPAIKRILSVERERAIA